MQSVGSDGTPTCVSAGGGDNALVTNDAVPRGNGTTQVAGSITDTGTAVTIANPTTVTSAGSLITGTSTPSARTSSLDGALVITLGGTYNATGGARASEAARFVVSSTRSAGSNPVNNKAIYASASGGQNNAAIQTAAGNNFFNTSSGSTGIGYAYNATLPSTLSVSGSISATTSISEGGNRVFSVAGNGLTSSGNEVSLDADLDLSANGTTTLGQVIETMQVETTWSSTITLGDTTRVLVLANSGAMNLDGITGGAHGRCIKLVFVGSSAVTMRHQNSNATTAADRLILGNAASWIKRVGNSTELCYEGLTNARWIGEGAIDMAAAVIAGTATVSGTFTGNGTAVLNGDTTLGNAATDDVGLVGTFRRASTDRVLGANVSGGTGAAWSVAVGGADDTTVAFDADLVSSAWTARDTSWGAIAKYGDKLKFFGGAGTSAGSDVTTTFGTKRSTPSMEIDLSSSALTVNGVASFENVATFNDDFIANAAAELYGTLYAYGNTLLGGADSNYIDARATLAFSGTNPTVNSCGGSPSISGEAQTFQVTVGGGVTACVINLNRTFASAPYCTFAPASSSAQNTWATLKPYITSTTTTVTLNFAINSESSPVYNVFCPDRR
jgi:hypothetical protein